MSGLNFVRAVIIRKWPIYDSPKLSASFPQHLLKNRRDQGRLDNPLPSQGSYLLSRNFLKVTVLHDLTECFKPSLCSWSNCLQFISCYVFIKSSFNSRKDEIKTKDFWYSILFIEIRSHLWLSFKCQIFKNPVNLEIEWLNLILVSINLLFLTEWSMHIRVYRITAEIY